MQNGKRVQVTIDPESIHENIDLLCKNKEILSLTHGFGHFKINTKDDYTESEEVSVAILTGVVLLILDDTVRFFTQTARQSLLSDLKTRICDKFTMEIIHIETLAYFAAIAQPSFNDVSMARMQHE